jgi:hypothetical protein
MPIDIGTFSMDSSGVKYYNYANILKPSLVLYYDFGIANCYAGSGTSVTNFGTGSYTGTLNNGPSFVTTDVGGCLSLDGTNDYISFSTITPGNGAWTVCIVAKQSSFNSNYGELMSNSSGGPVTNAFGTRSGYMSYDNYDGNWQNRSANTALKADRWYHYTWVNYSNNTMTMFLNGQSDSSNFNSYTTNGGPVDVIGRNWYSYFTGKIGYVAYYSGVSLSETQIRQNYLADKKRFGI